MEEMDIRVRQSDFSADNEGLERRIWNRLTQYRYSNKKVTVIPVNKNEITNEMMLKAMQCNDADELIALAKTAGYDLTREEAEACMAEIEDFELDDAQLQKVAGGIVWNGRSELTHVCCSEEEKTGPGLR